VEIQHAKKKKLTEGNINKEMMEGDRNRERERSVERNYSGGGTVGIRGLYRTDAVSLQFITRGDDFIYTRFRMPLIQNFYSCFSLYQSQIDIILQCKNARPKAKLVFEVTIQGR
jgi:hypothetical protein